MGFPELVFSMKNLNTHFLDFQLRHVLSGTVSINSFPGIFAEQMQKRNAAKMLSVNMG